MGKNSETIEKTKQKTHLTDVEFIWEKGNLFDYWVTEFDSLWEFILLEEFKKYLPDHVVVYLNEESK